MDEAIGTVVALPRPREDELTTRAKTIAPGTSSGSGMSIGDLDISFETKNDDGDDNYGSRPEEEERDGLYDDAAVDKDNNDEDSFEGRVDGKRGTSIASCSLSLSSSSSSSSHALHQHQQQRFVGTPNWRIGRIQCNSGISGGGEQLLQLPSPIKRSSSYLPSTPATTVSSFSQQSSSFVFDDDSSSDEALVLTTAASTATVPVACATTTTSSSSTNPSHATTTITPTITVNTNEESKSLRSPHQQRFSYYNPSSSIVTPTAKATTRTTTDAAAAFSGTTAATLASTSPSSKLFRNNRHAVATKLQQQQPHHQQQRPSVSSACISASSAPAVQATTTRTTIDNIATTGGHQSVASATSNASAASASTTTTVVRLPMPSPSRPRLHPRYASRLAPMMTTTSTTIRTCPSPAAVSKNRRPPAPNNTSSSSKSEGKKGTEGDDDHHQQQQQQQQQCIPPPEIHRTDVKSCSNIFRPTPIITNTATSYNDDDHDVAMDFCLTEHPSPCSVNHYCYPPVSGSAYFRTGHESTNNSSTSSLESLNNNNNNNSTCAQQQQRPTSCPSSVNRRNSNTSICSRASGVSTPMSCTSSTTRSSYTATTSHKRTASAAAVADMMSSDRFIPSRAVSSFNFNLWEGVGTSPRSGLLFDVNGGGRAPRNGSGDPAGRGGTGGANNGGAAAGAGSGSGAHDADDDSDDHAASHPATTAAQSQQNLLNTLLRSEFLGENDIPPSSVPSSQYHSSQSRSSGHNNRHPPLRDGANHLRYQSPRQLYQDSLFDDAIGPSAVVNSFSLTPVGSAASQRLMAAPPKRKRRISKVPFKVLDAPALQDDFYLNLVDWSSQNVLAVGLGSCVYLWSACTSKVTKLCDLATSEDIVTSVSWAQRGTHLAVGTNRGEVQLWDTTKCKRVRSMPGHSARVGTLAWTGPVLASGSRDRLIFLRDLRVQSAFTDKLSNHKQEVCGLKWSFDEPAFLASGGNDNHLHVIDSRNPSQPIHQFTDHTAAVKAIAWSPHQHGLLASGGGTADRCIRFWNTLSGAGLQKIDTGSQVCNLAWSQNCNEIVSTHGYSLNQIVIWRYPSMSKVATLTGHSYRVLYLSMSPDGSTIVTGAGDETLRFWQVFPGPRVDGKESTGGLLFPKTIGSVIR